ncbi:MAG: hypothetical protein H0V88_00465 [Pyrinomonadaceae bacterium]|nr:hypothetical protein [Pyrinomonadaceae bacterium]
MASRLNCAETSSALQQRLEHSSIIDPMIFGAFADGASHKISDSELAANRGKWRGNYVAGDEWDYVALQEAIYAAFGGPADDNTPTGWHKTIYARLNKPLLIPQGSYVINKTLELKGVSGFRIEGAMRVSTMITQTSPNRPVLNADGLSYGVIAGISFNAGAANSEALVEIDWTGAVSSLKPQQITVSDCVFHGQGLGAYGLRIAKSGSNAQGDTILLSNNLYISCLEAGLALGTPSSYAFNALSIMSLGGDVQNCPRYGIVSYAGSVFVYGTSFQNGDNLADFASFSGVTETIPFHGVRSESLRVVLSASVQHILIEGLDQNVSARVWKASDAFAVGELIAGSDGRIYRVTNSAGSAGAQPTWSAIPQGGSVKSGGITIQQLEFNVVQAHRLSLSASHITGGRVNITAPSQPSLISQCTFTRADWLVPGVADDGAATGLNNVVISGVSVGGAGRWAITSTTPYNLPFYTTSQFNLGTQPLIWSRGKGGQPFPDVGFAPGDGGVLIPGGEQANITRNVVGVIGTLGKVSRSGVNQVGEDLNIQGGLGTGSGGGGAIRLRAQAPMASGTDVPNSSAIVVVDHYGVSIGGGASVSRHLSAVSIWDPPLMANGETVTTSVTVSGAHSGDVVALGFTSINAGGWQISGQVTASDTVTITLTNQTGSTANLNSGTLRASVTQY